jgi:hypothetical protein
VEDFCRIIQSVRRGPESASSLLSHIKVQAANHGSIGCLGASTDDGRGMSMERLQAVESQMRLVFSAVLGRLDESVSLSPPTQASYKRSQKAFPVSSVSITSDGRSSEQNPANSPASAAEHYAPSKGIANLPEKSQVWTAEEVDHWLQARPSADEVALWLSGKAGLKGLAEACRIRNVDGVGLLTLLRQDELPPVSSGPTRPSQGLQRKKSIDGADVDLKVRAK